MVIHLRHGPIENGKPKYQGKVGAEVSLEEGYQASKITMLNLLSTVKFYLGSLDRIERALPDANVARLRMARERLLDEDLLAFRPWSQINIDGSWWSS